MDASWIIAALALGTVLRLSRLVVEDAITQPVRDALARRARACRLAAFLADLTACVWCTSVWAAFVVLAPVYAIQGFPWWTYPFAALTVSWVTGIAHSWLDSPPPTRHTVLHLADPVRAHIRTDQANVPGQTPTSS
ncbi:hypothetical protein [Streptomyces sp. NPDC088739]|uniref:hypothetical protein n=1 Tax=Streptomyces sp. NPDC088739 TaxID=3365882 RepID=UPI0038024771